MSAPKADHDALFAKWTEWLARVEEDVYRLHANHRVWKSLIEIIDSNSEIPERDFIRQWITRQHMEAMVFGIRRQTEVKDEVVTIASLLEGIRRNPEVITRQRFSDICSPIDDDNNLMLVVDGNFNTWAATGSDVIDPGLVEKRLDALGQTSANITDFVNQFLAHSAKTQAETKVSLDEVDVALDEIGRQLTDVYLLLTCKGLTSPEPTIQNPWRRAFSVPWLQPDEVDREEKIRRFVARRR